MRKLLLASLAALMPALALGADAGLQWAYPVVPQGLPPPDPVSTFQAKGATAGMTLTMAQIHNNFGPPDWFPDEHPPMPAIVKSGRPPYVRACMACHLAHGNGHPESASISGLTANYIIEQVHELRDGNRSYVGLPASTRPPAMVELARDITEAELKEAADYYASIPREQQKWIRVVEGKTAPKNHVGEGGMRFLDEGATETVPLPPNTIYEVAADTQAALLRDPHAGFIDFVPEGSVKKGKMLASTGSSGRTIPCTECHGADLRGVGDVPRLAGRGAYYMIRQLNDMKSGVRKGRAVAPMKPVVQNLSDEDMANLVAYMASLDP